MKRLLLPILLFLLGPNSLLAAQDPRLTLVENYVLSQLQGQPGQVTVTASPLDPRLRLPACQRYQPYTPPGTRLLGNVSIGLRCLEPGRWNIFIQVKIAIEGTYLSTAVPLSAGQTVQPSDILTLTGDLGSLPMGVLTDPDQAVGKTARFSLAPGQPLRQDQLTAPLVIQQGQAVKLIYQGNGFVATNDGKALNNATEGQLVRVRTASGTVVSGLAQPNGSVRVDYGSPQQ